MFKTRKPTRQRVCLIPTLTELVATDVVEEVDGVEVNRVVYKPKSIALKDNLDLPTRDEYSLENLLAAGVGLNQIVTTNLLNPTDPADKEAIGTVIAGRGYERLSTQLAKEKYEAAKNNEVKEDINE